MTETGWRCPYCREDCTKLVAERDELRQQHENDLHTIDVGSRANAALEIEVERLKSAVTDLGVLHITTHTENERLRAEVNDLINAASTAKLLLSRKHPHSVADCDGDAWEAWAVLEAALVNDKE